MLVDRFKNPMRVVDSGKRVSVAFPIRRKIGAKSREFRGSGDPRPSPTSVKLDVVRFSVGVISPRRSCLSFFRVLFDRQ